MKNPLLLLIGFLLFLWILLGSFLMNRNCNDCAGAAVVPALVPVTEDKPEKSISIADADLNFKASTVDNLLFPPNTCDYLEPISEPLQAVFGEAVTHLQDNSNRILILTGLYRNDETNDCAESQDLGFGRADKVKAMLIGMGAPGDRIRTASDSRTVEIYDKNVLGGVDYQFISMEERLRMGNITLYFETSDWEILLTSTQQDYFEDLKTYIGQNPDAMVSVGGHTDSDGSESLNSRISRKRAERVREYLIENGIPEQNVKHQGFGPTQPVESNETEEGKAKNRRVEVKIK